MYKYVYAGSKVNSAIRILEGVHVDASIWLYTIGNNKRGKVVYALVDYKAHVMFLASVKETIKNVPYELNQILAYVLFMGEQHPMKDVPANMHEDSVYKYGHRYSLMDHPQPCQIVTSEKPYMYMYEYVDGKRTYGYFRYFNEAIMKYFK